MSVTIYVWDSALSIYWKSTNEPKRENARRRIEREIARLKYWRFDEFNDWLNPCSLSFCIIAYIILSVQNGHSSRQAQGREEAHQDLHSSLQWSFRASQLWFMAQTKGSDLHAIIEQYNVINQPFNQSICTLIAVQCKLSSVNRSCRETAHSQSFTSFYVIFNQSSIIRLLCYLNLEQQTESSTYKCV